MNSRKRKKTKEKPKEAKEPDGTYGSVKRDKTIRFFSSFDEAEEYGRQKMAEHSPGERLNNLEVLRKMFFAKELLPDGRWPSLARTITIEKGTYL